MRISRYARPHEPPGSNNAALPRPSAAVHAVNCTAHVDKPTVDKEPDCVFHLLGGLFASASATPSGATDAQARFDWTRVNEVRVRTHGGVMSELEAAGTGNDHLEASSEHNCSVPQTPAPCHASPPMPRPSHPGGGGGGGEQVFVSQLEAVDLLQDHLPVVFALEEVGAAENGGDPLRFAPLDQHRGGRVVGLHPPGEEKRELR